MPWKGMFSGAGGLLFAAALNRRWNAHCFTVLCNRAARDIDSGITQSFHNRIVRQNVLSTFIVDQLANAMPDGFGRMSLATIGCGNRRGEEIFQFKDSATGRHVFICGYPRNCRFVHAYCISDGLEIEWTQVLDTFCEKSVLLTHDFARHLQNSLRALIERTH